MRNDERETVIIERSERPHRVSAVTDERTKRVVKATVEVKIRKVREMGIGERRTTSEGSRLAVNSEGKSANGVSCADSKTKSNLIQGVTNIKEASVRRTVEAVQAITRRVTVKAVILSRRT